jgi:hypothetical protein
MDRVGAGRVRRGEDPVDREIRLAARRRTDADGFVGVGDVWRPFVGVRIDRDTCEAHGADGA